VNNAAVPFALTAEGIKEVRKRLGMTQEEYARHLGKVGKHGNPPTVFQVNRWERGKARPGPMFAADIELAAKKAGGL
jgi:DNA-binding transcriptional regulator YiaG